MHAASASGLVSGGVELTVGTIVDGEVLVRVGTEILSDPAGGATFGQNRVQTSNQTLATGYSLVVSKYYQIVSPATLTLAGDAVLHIIG